MAGQQSDANAAATPTTTAAEAVDPKKVGKGDAHDGKVGAGSEAPLVTEKGVFDGPSALARLKKMEQLALASAPGADGVPSVTLDHGDKRARDVDAHGNKIERTPDGGVVASDHTGNLTFNFNAKTGVGVFKKTTGDGSIEATRAHDPAHPGKDTFTFNRFDINHNLVSSQETIPGGVRTTIGGTAIEQLSETYEQWKANGEERNLAQRVIALKDRTVVGLSNADQLVAGLDRHFELHHDGQRYLFDAQGNLSQVFTRDGKAEPVTDASKAEAAALLKAHDLHVDAVRGILGPGGESLKLGNGNVEVNRDKWSLLVEAGKSHLRQGDGTVTDMANGVVTSRDAKGQELFNYNVASNTFRTPDITFNDRGTTLGWSNQTIGTDGAIELANGQKLDGPGSPGFMVAGVEAQNLAVMTMSLAAQLAADPSLMAQLQAAINQLGSCRAECVAFNNLPALIQVDNSIALAERCLNGADKVTTVQNNPSQSGNSGQVVSIQSLPSNFSTSA